MKCSSTYEKEHTAGDLSDENVTEPLASVPAADLKAGDIARLQAELRETHAKLRTITQKFAVVRKEKDELKKGNKELQQDIMTLQNNMRQMLPGFANTGAVYPMYGELQTEVADCMKCTCVDAFFDLLAPELSMDGVVFFYKEVFSALKSHFSAYFDPVLSLLGKATCCDRIEGPLLSVLHKVVQNNWRRVLSECITPQTVPGMVEKLQSHLALGDCKPETNRALNEFLRKVSQVLFLCRISEPQLVQDIESLGTRVPFNQLKHESIDGFIKAKEMCIVIVPSIHKQSLDGDIIVKAHVLPVNYQFP